MTALHLCAAMDRTEPMKLLLKAGADSTLKDAGGRTALQIARQLGHHACQELVCFFSHKQVGILKHSSIISKPSVKSRFLIYAELS